MKKTIIPGVTPPSWDPDALYNKAERYVQHMTDFNSDDWEYALWSGLALELLARAALANVSPALLAETEKSWASLYHSLGFTPTEKQYAPKSITVSEVFKRLNAILPNFTKTHENFGILHTGRRNSELHSGELAYDGIKGSEWQPRFYETCEVLLTSMGMSLREFVGKDEAKVARKIIAASADEDAKAVQGEVQAHKKVWLAKKAGEREKLSSQAAIWATRQAGHRTKCPACDSDALVSGEPVAAPTRRLNEDEITETQEYLPIKFECIACGLKIAGLSRLVVVGVGERYKKTQVYDAAEFYAPQDEYSGYEDDNNEY